MIRMTMFASLLALPSSAQAVNRAEVTPAELARALIPVASIRAYHIDKTRIRPTDLRILRCVGPEEEPTEFECTWLQRTKG